MSEFEDFPINAFRQSFLPVVARRPIVPLRCLQQVTTSTGQRGHRDPSAGHAARLWCRILPESGFEALYQIATGDGLTISRAADIPEFVSEPGGAGEIGGVGFRADAFPIVIHVTDAVTHVPMDYAASGHHRRAQRATTS